MDRPSPLPGRGLGVGESISIPHPSSEGEGLSNAPTLRGIALYAIENTRWVPERSKNRIRSMVEGSPDWVIRSQRTRGRSDERRGGNECVSKCTSRWSTSLSKHKNTTKHKHNSQTN